MHPLFKKGFAYDPLKYRGLHLTSVLSKSTEKIVAMHLTDYLHSADAYGSSQWAFRPKHSCRDLVALVSAKWLLVLHKGRRVAVYLGDVSGAFDRVSSSLLLQKLQAVGVSITLIRFLESYLETRQATVIVNGYESECFLLNDMVFQGTVLGPPLWNLYFADISAAIPNDFEEKKFADDLTTFKDYSCDTEDEPIMAELSVCQAEVHNWGGRNQVFLISQKRHSPYSTITPLPAKTSDF